ncbi:MAG: hypothetical protein VX519_03115 [Myxococcota bacterium]|nr:hypothetical protein [Myxococcota bacterium]
MAQSLLSEVQYGVRWMAPVVLGLVLASSQANATPTELVPLNGPGHFRVSEQDGSEAIYYPVDPGSELEYAFTGPSKVVIWARSTRPPDQPWIYGPYLKLPVLADGWNVTDLVLRPRLTPMGTVDTAAGSFPILADTLLVEIPAQCSTLVLKAPTGGPGLLIRAVEPEPGDALLQSAHSTAVPPPEPTQTTESPAEENPEMWEAEDQLAVSIFEEEEPEEEVEEKPILSAASPVDEAAEEPAVTEPPAPVPPPPPPTLKARVSQSMRAIQVGPQLGAGAPAQGTQVSPYVGILSSVELFPLLWDAWKPEWGAMHLQVGLSWYALKVNEELYWQDPYAGPVTIDVSYRTDVVPLLFDLRYELPLELGPVRPFATLGAGAAFTRRVEGNAGSRGFAGSSRAALGAAMPAGPGLGLASLGWQGGRKNFGLLDPEGETAKEGLGVLRLELAYLVSF